MAKSAKQRSSAGRGRVAEPGAEVAQDAPEALSSGLRPQHILFAILVVGALLRLVYLVSIQDEPDYHLTWGDAAYKDFVARAILTGNAEPMPGQSDPQLETSPYVRPPGYSYFLAIVYLLSGYSLTAVRVLQMAVGLLSVWLLYRLARRVFAETVSLLAAFLMSTYWIFTFFEGELNSPALIVGLVLGILNLALDWADKPRLRTAGWMGLLYGLLVLDRPETLLFLPVLLGWCFFVAPKNLELPRRLAQLAAVPAVVVLLIVPVTIRNYLASGEFVPICTIGGLNLYAGNNPEATGFFPNINFQELFGVSQFLTHENFPQLVEALERKTGQTDLTQGDLEDYFVSEALRFMRENPGRTLVLALKKAAYFWGPHEISSDKVFEMAKQHSAVLRFLPPVAVFMPLAATGVFLLFMRRRVPELDMWVNSGAWKPLSLIALFCLVAMFTHMVFFVVARFRIPVMPFVLMFAAFSIAQIIRLLLARNSPLAGLWAGAAAVSALLFSIPWVPYQVNDVMFHFQRAQAYQYSGNVPDTIRELKLAVAAGGEGSAEVCSDLGFALSLQGELDNALFWYEKALELEPDDVLTLYRKGDIKLSRSENAEAAEAFGRAVQADFTHVPSRLGLVRALVRQDRTDEAEAVAAETLELDLGEFESKVMLGEIAGHRGKHDEALQHLESALALRPNDADIHNLMGLQLAALGRYEEAIASYRAAVELRPGFALAYTNLGNLYAHLGEYDKATIQYMDALNANNLEPGAEYGWGFVNAQRGEIEKAVERLRNAVAKRPNYVEALNYLGFLLMQQGKLDEARFNLEKAVRLNPRFLQARNNLGDLYARSGMTAEAQAQYQAALEVAPGEPYATEQLQKLQVGQPRPRIESREGQKVLTFPGS